MKNSLPYRIALLFLSTLLPFCFASADGRPEIKICATLPMTGSISFYGQGYKNAADMALDDLQAGKYHYVLAIEDDEGTAAHAVTAFQKLATFQKCQVIISATANIALALAPLATQKNIIHLGISSDSSFADGKNNFDVWPAPDIPVNKLIDQFKKRGIKKVALIGAEHAWPRAVFGQLVKSLEEEKMTVTMQEYFTPGENNFRPILEKFRRSNSDIGVFLGWTPDLEVFGRQYHQLKIPIPLTSEFSFETSQDLKLFNGFWFVNLRTPDPGYRERFKARFNYYPYAQMELGDLMMRLLVNAYEKTGDGKTVPSLPDIATALRSVKNYESIIGPVTIRDNGVLDAPYELKLVQDGKVEEGE